MKKYYSFKGAALTYEQCKALEKLAEERKHSISRVIRAAIKWYLEVCNETT